MNIITTKARHSYKVNKEFEFEITFEVHQVIENMVVQIPSLPNAVPGLYPIFFSNAKPLFSAVIAFLSPSSLCSVSSC